MNRLAEASQVLEGKLSGEGDGWFDRVSIDSRTITDGSNMLFIALNGQQHDGHKYVEEAYKKGVRSFIVERDFSMPDSQFLKVDNTLEAFHKLAKKHRESWSNPCIGITGSNGKTTVKEWLSNCLSKTKKIHRSPRSYNSQVGVALSILDGDNSADYHVLEAGISQPGEMIRLEEMIQPEIGLFLNIGDAHMKFFVDRQQLADEKALLFSNCTTLIHEAGNSLILKGLESANFKGTHITWGRSENAFLRVHSSLRLQQQRLVVVEVNQERIELLFPFPDEASEQNLMAVATTLFHLGFKKNAVQSAISSLNPISMRMEIIEGTGNKSIISDVYSNDLQSLKTALNELRWLRGSRTKKAVILSDLVQSGIPGKELYEKVFEMMRDQGVDEWVGVGSQISKYASLSGLPHQCFDKTTDLLESFDPESLTSTTILIKGARSFELEKILLRLQEQSHSTVLEVNIDHLIHNINYYKRKIGSKAKIMAMVKAFGYGAGSAQLANTLAYHQIDYLGVAYADEGISLRNQGINVPIMVMNVPKDAGRICLEYDLQPVVHSLMQFDSLIGEWNKLKATKLPPIHLELDTGMRRLGFSNKDLNNLLSRWKEDAKSIQIESIFSHFAGSDNTVHDDFTREQISMFTAMCQELETLPGKKIKHMCNTSGIERWPEATFDMVRLGIGMYGISSSRSEELKPVATLKTRVSQINIIEKGESVGYDRAFVAKKNTSIATLSIGYADGLNRALSNGKGQVLINGQMAPIVGKICMDMTMVDITGISAAVGDHVVVFGKNPRIETIAESLDTIGYEVLSGISQRVKRIYIHD